MSDSPARPQSADELLTLSPVIPVVVLDDAERAVPLARALARGGVGVIEITLRTPAGLDALERVAKEVPEIVAGAGTVTTPAQAERCAAAGAQFLVLPGATDQLLAAALDSGVPVLPGASTLSEMMRLAEHGLTAQKFFPAEAGGGASFLRAVAGPLPGIRFCPTGGISPQNATGYLALTSVPCVGGSWLTPVEAIAAGDWDVIEARAAEAAALGAA